MKNLQKASLGAKLFFLIRVCILIYLCVMGIRLMINPTQTWNYEIKSDPLWFAFLVMVMISWAVKSYMFRRLDQKPSM